MITDVPPRTLHRSGYRIDQLVREQSLSSWMSSRQTYATTTTVTGGNPWFGLVVVVMVAETIGKICAGISPDCVVSLLAVQNNKKIIN
jgi:hypothetical protein